MKYDIIRNRGSRGNSFLIKNILFDVGCSFKEVENYLHKIKYVCVTHTHGDHLNISTLKQMLVRRPSIIIITNKEVAERLIDNDVLCKILIIDKPIKIKNVGVITKHDMVHDVQNFGYSVVFESGYKFAYLTDSGDISHIRLKSYDLVVRECNYKEEKINNNIKQCMHEENWGMFNHFKRVKLTHLAEHQGQEWDKVNTPKLVIPWHLSERNFKDGF